MGLIQDIRTGREILSFGEAIAMTLIRIGRALFRGDDASAEEILRVRIREQAAGRAAHRASHIAGPRRS